MSKLKAYTFSVMAINEYEPAEEGGLRAIYYGHRSGVTVAPYIDAVAIEAEAHAFDIFPTSEGWTNHDLVVTPITDRFFAGLQQYMDAGLFTGEADPNEEMKEFHFGSDPTRILLDSDIQTEQ